MPARAPRRSRGRGGPRRIASRLSSFESFTPETLRSSPACFPRTRRGCNRGTPEGGSLHQSLAAQVTRRRAHTGAVAEWSASAGGGRVGRRVRRGHTRDRRHLRSQQTLLTLGTHNTTTDESEQLEQSQQTTRSRTQRAAGDASPPPRAPTLRASVRHAAVDVTDARKRAPVRNYEVCGMKSVSRSDEAYTWHLDSQDTSGAAIPGRPASIGVLMAAARCRNALPDGRGGFQIPPRSSPAINCLPPGM
jgi:hypothetical protein